MDDHDCNMQLKNAISRKTHNKGCHSDSNNVQEGSTGATWKKEETERLQK